MKVNNLVEEIFAQAVALDQSGGLKNTIYAIGHEIFILNYDHTVLLRFRLRQSEGTFDYPISFKANDYDSNHFEQADGRITFHSESETGEYTRKKVCGTTDLTPEEVKTLYASYTAVEEERSIVNLSKDVLSLLDSELSHIEFSGKAGESIKMIQRNIYSGGIIEVEKKNSGLFKEELENDFGPIAIKTDDFRALFNFQDVMRFAFPSREQEDYILVTSGDTSKRHITGVIACCLYDELIQIKELRKSQPVTTSKFRRK